jgi:hypothetical protein
MMSVYRAELPSAALLIGQARPDDYLDCFAVDLPQSLSLEGYAWAFYTSWLFKLERLILGWAGHPSTDQQARALARGEIQAFAAWKLEAREAKQMLMRDVTGATCSWLMVEPISSGTRLYFGSGVRARKRQADGSLKLPFGYRALMGLHVLYSRALLAVAAKRLQRDHG